MEHRKVNDEGEGGGGGACPQTPRFWKTPLEFSRFGSFENCQFVNIAAYNVNNRQRRLPDCKIHLVLFKTCSTRLQKAMIKQLYDRRRLKLRAIACEFLIVFYCQIPLFCSRPNSIDELSMKRLLGRLKIDWKRKRFRGYCVRKGKHVQIRKKKINN